MRPYRSLAVIGGLAALGAGALWMGREYRGDIGRARRRIATGSRVIATSCGPIEYAEAGTGPPVLFIHGAGGGFDQGLEVGGPLARRGYRLIAMSRFGYLRTPAPDHPSIARQAEAHASLLDALEVRRAAVVGVSAGAPSAMEFALKYPARCQALVVLVPGWFPPGTSGARRLGRMEGMLFSRLVGSDFLFWAFTRFFPKSAQRAVLGTASAVVMAANARERERLAAMLKGILPVSRRSVGLSLEARLTVEELSAPLESMACPALAISVEDDLYRTCENARYIAWRIPGCQLVCYRTGGHLFVGHGEEMTSTVIEFLRGHGWVEGADFDPSARARAGLQSMQPPSGNGTTRLK